MFNDAEILADSLFPITSLAINHSVHTQTHAVTLASATTMVFYLLICLHSHYGVCTDMHTTVVCEDSTERIHVTVRFCIVMLLLEYLNLTYIISGDF